MNKWHRRDISIAANELWLRENEDRCQDLIAQRFDFDVPWLSQGLADVLRHGGSPESLGRLYTATEKHCGPILTEEAVAMLERAEDPA